MQKEQEIKEALSSKNQIKDKLSKYSRKLAGITILKEARYEIWDQISWEVTTFGTHLEVV